MRYDFVKSKCNLDSFIMIRLDCDSKYHNGEVIDETSFLNTVNAIDTKKEDLACCGLCI